MNEEERQRAESRFNIDSSKRQVIYFTTTDKPSHGIPVVVDNIRKGLEETGDYQTYLLVNGFNDNNLKLTDGNGNEVEYESKEELIEGLRSLGNGSADWLDIFHFHTVTHSDHFFHPNGPQNSEGMSLDEFLESFPKTKTMFTNHGEPYLGIEKIKELFGVDIRDLTKEGVARFINEERLKERVDWQEVHRNEGPYKLMTLKSTEQMIDLVDQVTFVSDYQRLGYMENFFRHIHPRRKPAVVYNGADLGSYANDPGLDALAQSVAREFGIRPDKYTVLYVGRMSEDKGIFELAEVIKRLRKERPLPRDVQVVYVGDVDSQTQERITQIFGTRFPEGVILTDLVKDRRKLAALYKLSDVVAQPTHGDCFNQTAAEALIFGKPVLISNIGGPKEVYVDEGVAFGHKPGDVDDIYRKLLHIFTHPDEVQSVTEKGQLYVACDLDYKIMSERYSGLYDELLSSISPQPKAGKNLFEELFGIEPSPKSASEEPVVSEKVHNELGIEPAKRNVLLLGATRESSYGAPVVMNNLGARIASNPNYNVFYLINSLVSREIQLYTPNGEILEFENRRELLDFLGSQDMLGSFDVLHLHSWRFSDYYMPQADMPIAEFLGSFRNASVVYTDHSGPSEDMINIREQHGVDFSKLSPQQKAEYIERFRIRRMSDDLEKRWVFTGLKCKEQLMELADQVVNVSNAQKQGTKELLPHARTKAEPKVIYNGIDMVQYSRDQRVEQRAEELRSQVAENGEKIILYVGRLSEHKGAYDLATASRFLHGILGMENFKVVYVGSDRLGEDFCSAQTKCELFYRSGNNGHVTFLRPTSDRRELAALYKMADVVVQPTHGESFNQVIGEALAVGTPVIASRTSGPEEVYIDRGVAIGHEPRDIGDLTITLENFLNDGEVSGAMAARGQQYVASELSVDAMTQKYLAVYDKLVQGR